MGKNEINLYALDRDELIKYISDLKYEHSIENAKHQREKAELLFLRDDVDSGWTASECRRLEKENDDLRDALSEKERQISKLTLAYENQEQKLQETMNTLENTVRVIRERSNAERDIRPKGSRSGYIVQYFEELTERVSTYDCNEVIPVYRTIFQTCYTDKMELEVIRQLVRHDLQTTVLPELSLNNSEFIDDAFLKDPEILIKDAKDENTCYIYRLQLKLTPAKRYYDAVIFHTNPIGPVPDDLIMGEPEKSQEQHKEK